MGLRASDGNRTLEVGMLSDEEGVWAGENGTAGWTVACGTGIEVVLSSDGRGVWAGSKLYCGGLKGWKPN